MHTFLGSIFPAELTNISHIVIAVMKSASLIAYLRVSLALLEDLLVPGPPIKERGCTAILINGFKRSEF